MIAFIFFLNIKIQPFLYIIINPGQGHYGDVFVGKLASNLYNNSNNNNSGNNTVDNQVIMVKSFLLKSESTAEQCLKEIDMFGRCEHKHVVRLLGLCVEVEPLFVVLENTEWVGNGWR